MTVNLPHTSETDLYLKRTKTTNAGRDVVKNKPIFAVGKTAICFSLNEKTI